MTEPPDRADAQLEERLRHASYLNWDELVVLSGEAADTIAQLRAEQDKLLGAYEAVTEAWKATAAELATIKSTNSELCSSHNALLVDGARWQARAETAEAALTAAEHARDELRGELKHVAWFVDAVRKWDDGGCATCACWKHRLDGVLDFAPIKSED